MGQSRDYTPEEREEIMRRRRQRMERASQEAQAANRSDVASGRRAQTTRRPQQSASPSTNARASQQYTRQQQRRSNAQSQPRAAQPQRPAAYYAGQQRPRNAASARPLPNDASRYSREAYASRLNQQPKKSRTAAIVVGIVVAIVVVIALAFFAVKMLGSSSNATTNAQVNNTADSNVTLSATDNASTKSAVNSPEAEAAIVLTLSGDYDTYVLKGEEYLEPGAHAVENHASDITSSIKVEGNVDANKAGDYSVTYTATSSTGLQVQRTRTVHVVDSMDKNTGGIPVLMYHYVYTTSDAPDEIDNNYILDTDFEAQLQYLTQNGYYYPSYQELLGYIKGTHSLPAKSVILTFDDGEGGFLAYGVPLLEKYKIPGTSFLVGVDNIDPCLTNASPYVTYQSHSYNMHHAGGTVGHGGVISAMTQAEILADLQQNIKMLGSSDAFAYPYGDTTAEGQAAVREAGILCAFTTDYDYVHVGDDPTLLSRVRVLGSYSLESFIASLNE